ncbi:MAG: DUF5994 family protein [Propionibacteriales bacterium]|nr:DUF5994 family protein [Propionibacteriales bacterium]
MALRARTTFAPLVSARPAPEPDGAWWPRSRSLAEELPGFFDAWPPERGRIQRILYSSPDWDDHPHSVTVPGRRVKTGTFPREDTHVLTVCMADRSDHIVAVIASSASADVARQMMATFDDDVDGDDAALPRWSGEGGSV